MKRKRIKKLVTEFVATSKTIDVENFIHKSLRYIATSDKFDKNKNNKHES